MKKNTTRSWMIVTATAASLGAWTLTSALAQSDVAPVGSDPVYVGDPINIEGYKKDADVPPTDRELESAKNELLKQKKAIQLNKEKAKAYTDLSKTTEKLVDVQDEMLDSKIESQKSISEYNQKMDSTNKRMECLAQNNWDPSKCKQFGARNNGLYTIGMGAPAATPMVNDSVATQAASVQKVEAPLPKVETRPSTMFQITPYAGMTSFQGSEYSFESKITTGLRMESKVHERVAIGVGFGYTTMAITELPSMYSTYMGVSRSNPYGEREMTYTNMGGDVYTKVYLLTQSKIRPYVGAGIAYSRTSLKYKDQEATTSAYYATSQAQDSTYTANNYMGEGMGGLDFMFTDNIGINVEGRYVRSFSSTSNEDSNVTPNYGVYSMYSDKVFLEKVGSDIDNANDFTLTGGLTVAF